MKRTATICVLSAAVCGCMSMGPDGDLVIRRPAWTQRAASPRASDISPAALASQYPNYAPGEMPPARTFWSPGTPKPALGEPVAQRQPTSPVIPVAATGMETMPHLPSQPLPIAATNATPPSAQGIAAPARPPLAHAPPLPPPVNTTNAGTVQAVSHSQVEATPTKIASSTSTREYRSLAGRNILAFPSRENRTDEPRPESPPITPAAASVPANDRLPTPGSAVRMVNTRRVQLNYEVRDVGPSGIAGIELWYTSDGRTWKMYEGPAQRQPPFAVELPGEGVYGLTLLARSGGGQAKEPPPPSEPPQAWVEVDLTRPAVTPPTVEVSHAGGTHTMTLRWTSTDKNLAAKPITIACAEQADGPWTPIAVRLENNGQFTWQMPPTVPRRFHVRVEAVDLAGNIGHAQVPVNQEGAQPTVSILAIEPGGK